MDLTDEQWVALEPLLPKPPKRADGRGRPWRKTREVLNGVLWVLRTGAPWHDLPERYPPYQTCHRRFQGWVCDGTLGQVLATLAEDLKGRKKPKTQDGRKLRRYKRRWRVERLFAWLGNFRRLVVRYERQAENYLGFVQLGCVMILLRHL